MNKASVKLIAKYLIGVFLIGYVFLRSNPESIYGTFLKINIYWLGIMLLWWCIDALFRALLWKIYLSAVDMRINMVVSFKSIALAALIDKALPGHTGSFFRPFYLKKLNRDFSLPDATAAVGVEKFVTLASYFLIVVSGLIFFKFYGVIPGKIIFLISAIAVLYLLVIGAAFFAYKKRSVIRRLADKLQIRHSRVLYSFLHRLLNFLTRMADKLKPILTHKGIMAAGVFLQLLISLILTAIMFYLSFRAFGIKVGFTIPFILIPCISYSASLVPFSPNGIGIVELIGLALFTNILGYAQGEVLSVFLLVRAVYILMPLLVGGTCYFLFIRKMRS